MDRFQVKIGDVVYFAAIGKVDATTNGLNDYGHYSCWLQFDFGGCGQSFGCSALSQWDSAKNRAVGTAAGLDYLIQVMRVFGVTTIEDIKSRYAHALYADDKFHSTIVGIKAMPQEGGKHFLISEWLKEWGIK